jgi:hypothetical protein
LLIAVQLFSAAQNAPPPSFAQLFDSTQLFNVPRKTPPPETARLVVITQLEISAALDSHQIPPPLEPL